MPLKMRIIAGGILLTAGLAWSGISFTKKYNPPQPGSYPTSSFSSRGLVSRVIALDLSHDEAKTNSEKINVKVRIKMPFAFDEKLNYHWKLGPGVSLIEGAREGQLDGLLANEEKELVITVSGFSPEANHHIGFEILGEKNGRRVYGNGLIASDPDSTFESVVQHVEKIKASE